MQIGVCNIPNAILMKYVDTTIIDSSTRRLWKWKLHTYCIKCYPGVNFYGDPDFDVIFKTPYVQSL